MEFKAREVFVQPVEWWWYVSADLGDQWARSWRHRWRCYRKLLRQYGRAPKSVMICLHLSVPPHPPDGKFSWELPTKSPEYEHCCVLSVHFFSWLYRAGYILQNQIKTWSVSRWIIDELDFARIWPASWRAVTLDNIRCLYTRKKRDRSEACMLLQRNWL